MFRLQNCPIIFRYLFYFCIYLNGEIFAQPDIRNSILYGKTLAAAHTAPLLFGFDRQTHQSVPKKDSVCLKIFHSTGLRSDVFYAEAAKKGRNTNSCLKVLYD
ncbi:MAG TPA: hypothetical protein DEB43_00375 [Desulfovibrio sp.]|nr:hypothetical protein [Desulfovibrio sp.]